MENQINTPATARAATLTTAEYSAELTRLQSYFPIQKLMEFDGQIRVAMFFEHNKDKTLEQIVAETLGEQSSEA